MRVVDIYKVAGILVRERKTLVVRAHKDARTFMTPGGKPESNESTLDTLRRELGEELGVDKIEASPELLGSFQQEAFNKPGKLVQIDAYLVREFSPEPKPSQEIVEIRWVTSSEAASMNLAHIFKHDIIPILVKKGLID